jgi:hypothetical protein
MPTDRPATGRPATGRPATGSLGRAAPAALAALLLAFLPGMAPAQDDPLSAIDWLSQSVAAPATASVPLPAAPGGETPVAGGGAALPADVSTTPLDGPSPDAVGLISPAVSGLPRDLWGAGRTEDIARALTRDRMDSLPALRQLVLTILLAEAAPPADSGGQGRLLLARIDKLLQIGALEQAAALIDIAGAATPALFRRAFDVAPRCNPTPALPPPSLPASSAWPAPASGRRQASPSRPPPRWER